VQNFNGTLSNATVSSNTITSPTTTATSKGSGIRLQALGSASTAANVTKATISSNVISNFPSGAGILAQGGNANAGGPTGTFGVAGNVSNIITISSNQIKGQSSANLMGTSSVIASVVGQWAGELRHFGQRHGREPTDQHGWHRDPVRRQTAIRPLPSR